MDAAPERQPPSFKGGSVVLDAAGDIYVEETATSSQPQTPQRSSGPKLNAAGPASSPQQLPTNTTPPSAGLPKSGRRVQPEEVGTSVTR